MNGMLVSALIGLSVFIMGMIISVTSPRKTTGAGNKTYLTKRTRGSTYSNCLNLLSKSLFSGSCFTHEGDRQSSFVTQKPRLTIVTTMKRPPGVARQRRIR